jgi:outer membrane receptor for ferrienterochelin and colicins
MCSTTIHRNGCACCTGWLFFSYSTFYEGNTMKQFYILTTLLFCMGVVCSYATVKEQLHGTVFDYDEGQKRPLGSASVIWLHQPKAGTLTAKDGSFKLDYTGTGDEYIIVRYAGYQPDTVDVRGRDHVEIVLDQPIVLDEVTVEGNRSVAAEIHRAPVKTEIITAETLEKDACCDLSGCFNTSAAVEPNVTDVVTDKQELQILGLSGVYNQVLVDGTPMLMTGLNSGYGLNYLPGPFIQRIAVVKGANSVVQGYESISGMVDVRMKEPDQMDRLYANIYLNGYMEKQLNLAYANQVGGGWNTMLAGHVTQPSGRYDRAGDSFLDMPLVTQYSLLNKWKFSDEDSPLTAFATAKYTREERIGGEKFFDVDADAGTQQRYGQTVETDRVEAYAKTSLKIGEGTEWSTSVSGTGHRQHSWFGLARYKGDQTTIYAGTQLKTELLEEQAFLTTGFSFRMENIRENLDLGVNPLNKTYGGAYIKNESTPGLYAEGVVNLFDDQLTLMPGIRLDFNNLHGTFVTPRFLAKYSPDELTTLRATAGTGLRTVNFWSENSTLLAGGRNIVFLEPLQAERAVNFGVSVSRIVDFAGLITTIGADFFRTNFRNRVYADYEQGANAIVVYNIQNGSFSNSAQLEAATTIAEEWDAKLAYTWLDAQFLVDGRYEQMPFITSHKFLAVLSFSPQASPWRFSVNAHWYGSQRLPSTESNPVEHRRPTSSDPYALFNAQVTWSWETLDFYAGAENLFDFRQKNPIIDPEHPFGQYFDTSFIWGPVKGREVYVGIRYGLGDRVQ